MSLLLRGGTRIVEGFTPLFDGPAELPRSTYTPAFQLPSGTVRTVSTSGTNSDRGTALQSALNAAVSGDVVVVPSGFTYAGTFTMPAKTGSDPVYVVSDTVYNGTFTTAEGQRVAGTTGMPTLLHSGSVSTPLYSTAYQTNSETPWRMVGLNFEIPAATNVTTFAQVGDINASGVPYFPTAAQQPKNYTFDRCYFTGKADSSTRRALGIYCENVFVTGCVMMDIVAFGNNGDSQGILCAIHAQTINVYNCEIAGATEAIVLGGVAPGGTQSTWEEVATDITVQKCYFRHLDYQRPVNAAPVDYVMKCLVETKGARRFLVEDCILENQFAADDAQQAINIKSEPVGSFTTCTEDVTIRRILFKKCAAFLGFRGFSGLPENSHVWRVSVHDGVFQDPEVEPVGILAQCVLLTESLKDIRICNNTVLISDTNSKGVLFNQGTIGFEIENLTIQDNIFTGATGISNSGTPDTGVPSYVIGTVAVDHNALIGRPSASYPANGFSMPASIAAVGFVDDTTDLTLDVGSPLLGVSSTGGNVGADAAAVYSSTANVTTGAL